MPDRFWEKVRQAPSGCWRWVASTNGKYGKVYRKGKLIFAHRWAYAELVGPIPEGLVVDHLCRNRLCVNPLHLQAVTHQTNLLRGMTITARNAARTECPHGHPYDEENTYVVPKSGFRQCRACHAARYPKAPRLDTNNMAAS